MPQLHGLRAARARRLGRAPRALRRAARRRARAPDATLVVDGMLGSIHAFRGESSAARPLLVQCLDTRLAPRRRLDDRGQRRRARLAGGARGRRRPRPRALPLRAGALGAQRGPPLRGLGPSLGVVLLRPPRRARRGARVRRGAVEHRAPRPATRTLWRRSRTRSARRRSPRATPTPPRSSSAARPSFTRASRSRSSERRSSSAQASRSPRRGQREAALERLAEAHGRRAASAPRRWPLRRPRRSPSSASPSSANSGGARRPTTRTPACPAASSR